MLRILFETYPNYTFNGVELLSRVKPKLILIFVRQDCYVRGGLPNNKRCVFVLIICWPSSALDSEVLYTFSKPLLMILRQ